MLHINVIIAGVQMTFWTSYDDDIDCLKDMLPYHINQHVVAENFHDIIITSSKGAVEIPEESTIVWKGVANNDSPVSWYNSPTGKECYITIGNDIVIRHLLERKLTICNLIISEGKTSCPEIPRLTCCIFILLQSILSIHGKYCLHSSCVSKDGYTYLFLGKSGEGKSTISYIMAKNGYEFMGDDLVFISKNKDDDIIIDALLIKPKLQNMELGRKEAIDIIKKHHLKYSHRGKLGAIIKLQRTFETDHSSIKMANGTDTFTNLINSGNNIKILHDPCLWLDICEKSTKAPSFSLYFAEKKFFNPQILHNIIKSNIM